jgi:hypothetical protein
MNCHRISPINTIKAKVTEDELRLIDFVSPITKRIEQQKRPMYPLRKDDTNTER